MSKSCKILIFLTFFYLQYISKVLSEITVQGADMRSPKPNDIGLMFDVTLVSNGAETAEIRIRSEKCCVNLAGNGTMCDGSKIVGGYFGKIDHQATKIVTVVWPTVTIYNRVGYCDICLVSNNITTDDKHVTHRVAFDTMIAPGKVPYIMHDYVGNRNISKCSSLDLNPLSNCEPAICEEKYFGRRNYFNPKTLACEPVPSCSESEIYDYLKNECMDIDHFVCGKDLKGISDGKFDDNVYEFSTQACKNNDESNRHKNEFTQSDKSVWIEAIGHSLVMICFGISAYLVICFFLYLMIYLCSKNFGCQEKVHSRTKL